MTVICGICDNPITRKQPSIDCAGLCKNQVHATCVTNVSVDLVNILSTVTGLTWKCSTCVDNCMLINEGKLNELIENKIVSALSTLTAEFAILKDELLEKFSVSNNYVTLKQSPPKYSEVLRNKTEPAVLIKPKSAGQSNSQTKSDIMQNISPVGSDFQLSKVKHTKEGGILVSCKNKEENERFKRLAEDKLSNAYEVKELRGINPRVRVAGMSQKFENEELLNIIRKQNGQLINSHSDCKLIKCYPIKKNSSVYQAVLQLDKLTYERVMKAGNLFIGFDSCRIYNAVEVHRCFNCNGFSHSSKACYKACTCPRCGENHSVKDCKSETLVCVNCTALKSNENFANINVDHAAWDVNKCSAYIQACDNMRTDILANQ